VCECVLIIEVKWVYDVHQYIFSCKESIYDEYSYIREGENIHHIIFIHEYSSYILSSHCPLHHKCGLWSKNVIPHLFLWLFLYLGLKVDVYHRRVIECVTPHTRSCCLFSTKKRRREPGVDWDATLKISWTGKLLKLKQVHNSGRLRATQTFFFSPESRHSRESVQQNRKFLAWQEGWRDDERDWVCRVCGFALSSCKRVLFLPWTYGPCSSCWIAFGNHLCMASEARHFSSTEQCNPR